MVVQDAALYNSRARASLSKVRMLLELCSAQPIQSHTTARLQLLALGRCSVNIG